MYLFAFNLEKFTPDKYEVWIPNGAPFYDNHIQTCDASHLEDILLKTAANMGMRLLR